MNGRVLFRFWGWNNEVHVYEPYTATWTEPQIQVKGPMPAKSTRDPKIRFSTIGQIGDNTFFSVIVFLLQGRPPEPRASHASAILGSKGYICGGLVSGL